MTGMRLTTRTTQVLAGTVLGAIVGAEGGCPEEAGLRPAGTHEGSGWVTGAEIRIRGGIGAPIGVECGAGMNTERVLNP